MLVVTMNLYMRLFGAKKHETILVMEITSGGVVGAFFIREKGEKPTILDAVRRDFLPREQFDPNRLREDMVNALAQVSQQLQKLFHARPDFIYVVLNSPWSHSEISGVLYENKRDFKFTEKFGMKLLAAEKNKLNKKDENLSLIDSRTLEVLLNGYSSPHPNGKLCRTAELRCLFSFASQDILNLVRDSLHRFWKSKVIFTSSILSDYTVVRDLMPASHGVLLINVSSEVTEVTMSHGGQLTGTATFPFGESTFLRESAKVLRKSVIETGSLFSLVQSKSLKEEDYIKSETAFNLSREKWQTLLKEILFELNPARRIPHDVCFSSNSRVSEFLCSGFQSRFFPEFTTTDGGFNAILINMNILHDLCHWRDGVNRDARIAMITIFISRS